MTSLEFIKNEIQNAKELLQRLEKLKVNSNKYELQLNEVLEKDTQEKLFYLEQIKVILEAWEFTKEELNLQVIERNCGAFGSKYALRCDYEDDIPLLDKEAESFKKALEVKE